MWMRVWSELCIIVLEAQNIIHLVMGVGKSIEGKEGEGKTLSSTSGHVATQSQTARAKKSEHAFHTNADI